MCTVVYIVAWSVRLSVGACLHAYERTRPTQRRCTQKREFREHASVRKCKCVVDVCVRLVYLLRSLLPPLFSRAKVKDFQSCHMKCGSV